MTPYEQIVALLPSSVFFHCRSIFYNVDPRHHRCKIKPSLDNNNNNLYGPSQFTLQMQQDLSIIVVPIDCYDLWSSDTELYA